MTEITADLSDWLNQLKNKGSEPVQVLLPPTQQMIGDRVYEVMFIADADGLPLEFIRVMPT